MKLEDAKKKFEEFCHTISIRRWLFVKFPWLPNLLMKPVEISMCQTAFNTDRIDVSEFFDFSNTERLRNKFKKSTDRRLAFLGEMLTKTFNNAGLDITIIYVNMPEKDNPECKKGHFLIRVVVPSGAFYSIMRHAKDRKIVHALQPANPDFTEPEPPDEQPSNIIPLRPGEPVPGGNPTAG